MKVKLCSLPELLQMPVRLMYWPMRGILVMVEVVKVKL